MTNELMPLIEEAEPWFQNFINSSSSNLYGFIPTQDIQHMECHSRELIMNRRRTAMDYLMEKYEMEYDVGYEWYESVWDDE